jgi:alcohol dehydrogenase class IV
MQVRQELMQGEQSIRQAGEIISGRGYKTVFLITGRHLQKDMSQALPSHLQVQHFIKQGTNVEKEEMLVAVEQFRQDPCEVILAIGGGSVMDLGKAVIYHCAGSLGLPFFIAAPTTAGSGSEATHFGVTYDGKKKQSLAGPHLLPALVILDPQLTWSLPAHQTAISGMDVLAQGIESYWNIHATDQSKQYAREAIALWKRYYEEVVNQPGKEAREKMMWASHLSGKAVNITRTTGPHALSYYLTANFNVPHGQAVALLLPLFFLYNEPSTELCSLLGVKNPAEAKEYIQRTMQNTGLATRLDELGINTGEIIDELLNEVNEERFANNPAVFDREKLKELINTYL